MAFPSVGIVASGEMGAAVGGALRRAGVEVATVLAGRGAESEARAREAGMRDCASLDELVGSCDLFLSIVPPAVAVETGRRVAAAMRATGKRPDFVECNAIAPQTLFEALMAFEGLDATLVDAGIVGVPPKDGKVPRTYISGPASATLDALDGIAFDIVRLGPEPGTASGMKMVYASITKGTNALLAAALLSAARLDLLDPLLSELAHSQPVLHERAQANMTRLPADSARWAPEMEEISRTFGNAGLPPDFHRGAAELMRVLARSRYGQETRRTLDRSRSAEETIRRIAEDIGKSRA